MECGIRPVLWNLDPEHEERSPHEAWSIGGVTWHWTSGAAADTSGMDPVAAQALGGPRCARTLGWRRRHSDGGQGAMRAWRPLSEETLAQKCRRWCTRVRQVRSDCKT
ncbi:hypothetical protein NDU88_006434 [Pleurodeles waltl]|uniref:Uncharacterized protein n=1 Tax=Pleurodeles waltl TaxID=8319 RepID=A0AAV7TE57_PLEWA|nr:hypothetical protein NDU88_006434 [Pleurodeles waltl]